MVTGEDKNGVWIFSWSNGELVKEVSEPWTINNKLTTTKFIIVDLDLDYFAQGFDTLKCLETIRFWFKKANIITIATSPLFIEQTQAIEFVKSLQKDLVTL